MKSIYKPTTIQKYSIYEWCFGFVAELTIFKKRESGFSRRVTVSSNSTTCQIGYFSVCNNLHLPCSLRTRVAETLALRFCIIFILQPGYFSLPATRSLAQLNIEPLLV